MPACSRPAQAVINLSSRIACRSADPARDQAFDKVRMIAQQDLTDALHRGQQRRVAGEIGDTELKLTGLACAE